MPNRVGEADGDGLADVADAVPGQGRPGHGGVEAGEAGWFCGEVEVVAGQHRSDTRHRPGLVGVDGRQVSVGFGRADEDGVECPLGGDVTDVVGGTEQQLVVLAAPDA